LANSVWSASIPSIADALAAISRQSAAKGVAVSRPNRCPISSASIPIRKPPALTGLFSAFVA